MNEIEISSAPQQPPPKVAKPRIVVKPVAPLSTGVSTGTPKQDVVVTWETGSYSPVTSLVAVKLNGQLVGYVSTKFTAQCRISKIYGYITAIKLNIKNAMKYSVTYSFIQGTLIKLPEEDPDEITNPVRYINFCLDYTE